MDQNSASLWSPSTSSALKTWSQHPYPASPTQPQPFPASPHPPDPLRPWMLEGLRGCAHSVPSPGAAVVPLTSSWGWAAVQAQEPRRGCDLPPSSQCHGQGCPQPSHSCFNDLLLIQGLP